MIRFAKEASEAELREAIYRWIDLLAADRYEEAFEMMLQFPTDEWTPDMMRTVVRNYGFIEPLRDGRTFRVTPRAEAAQRGQCGPSSDIDWFADGRGIAHFDLPLNGEWSDVTAIIDIVKKGEDRVFRLNDIHVL